MGCCTSDDSTDRQRLVQPEKKRGGGGEFTNPYMFKAKNTVIIKHPGGSQFRVANTGDGVLGNGGKGKFARFEAIPENNGNRVKFRSLHNGKYLRIHHHERKNKLDCGGGGGKFTLFKVHHLGQKGHVKLESVHC